MKDAFDRYVVHGEHDAVNPQQVGHQSRRILSPSEIPAGQRHRARASVCRRESETAAIDFDAIFAQRIRETNLFYGMNAELSRSASNRASGAGRPVVVEAVLSLCGAAVAGRRSGSSRRLRRALAWPQPRVEHLYNRDVISMPDNWEFPWYASWDLAFHMLPFAEIDPDFAKEQLILLLREWYTHPSGQIPAYEFAFGDVNPPVHAWAAWRVYKISAPRGQRDRAFLERVFQKLLINFTWWVNRKDIAGKQVFSGGFLGLDNVGIFDRSKPLPNGGVLEQADGSAWMAFYCTTMLAMALELASDDPAYEDVASKFFEHFVAITDAMNTLGGTGPLERRGRFLLRSGADHAAAARSR